MRDAAARTVAGPSAGRAAVEVALKMAFQYHRHRGAPRRDGFICLRDAYHGDTIGSVSVGGIDLFHRIFGPLLFDVKGASTLDGLPVRDLLVAWEGRLVPSIQPTFFIEIDKRPLRNFLRGG